MQELVFSAFKTSVDGDYSNDANISIKLLHSQNNISMTYQHLPSQAVVTYHPASLIKLFHAYLAKAKIQVGAKNILKADHPHVFGDRTIEDDVLDAIAETLKSSDNDALSLLMDFNSETVSGLRLYGEDFEFFKKRRQAVTEFFQNKAGYSDLLNLAGKCFSFGPYGRERQISLEPNGLGRNCIVVDDAVAIMQDILRDFPELAIFMARSLDDKHDEQIEFIARGLEKHQKHIKTVISKAGWTSLVRHDVACIKLQSHEEYILAICTKGLSQYTRLIPSISEKILEVLVK